MSTDLIVEDGTGKADANSFVSLAEFKKYCCDRGKDITAYTNDQRIHALIRATQYLSESFRWKGIRKIGRNSSEEFQALSWPRYGIYDREGAYINSDSLPRELKWATSEVAFYELQNPEGLQPVYTAHNRQKMIKAGSVAITYDTYRRDAYGARPVMLSVLDLIGQFVNNAAGNRLSGLVARV